MENNIIENFKNFILSKYKNSQEEDLKVLFEGFGHHITEDDVTDYDFSMLVNSYPNSKSDVYQKNFQKLDSLYRIILNSCKPTQNNGDNTSFTRMKTTALRILETYNIARNEGIADLYLKTEAIPSNWFTNNKYWLNYSIDNIKNNLKIKIISDSNLKKIQSRELKTPLRMSSRVKIEESVNQGRLMSTKMIKSTTAIPNLSLKYCIVDIDRKWLTTSLFTYFKNWYVPKKRKGAFSIDSIDFQYIPVAMIVIRKLQINAAWSKEDLQNISKAVSIGPFSLIKSEWSNNGTRLQNENTQIIGWICSKLPQIPPQSDPSLSPNNI